MSSTGMSILIYHILLMCVSLISATITCVDVNGDGTIQNCTLGNDGAGILDEFPPHVYTANTLYANNQREILDISSTAFDLFTDLHILHLNDNSLRTVSPDWFKNLEKLTTINLSGNFISDVTDGTFSPCKQLNSISLSRNLIENFLYLSNDLHLADLYLSENPLKQIEIAPVNRLNVDVTNLTELHLKNDIKFIMASNSRISSFSAPSSLEVLFLDENNLSDITNITDLNSLLILDLSGNNIGTLSPAAFLNLHKLELLNLSQNNISHLYYGLFANQENLWELNLSENKITHFNTNHLRRTRGDKTIGYLYLENNPINEITDDGIVLKNLLSFYLGGYSSDLDCQKLLNLYTTYENIKVANSLKQFDVDNIGGIGCHDPNKHKLSINK